VRVQYVSDCVVALHPDVAAAVCGAAVPDPATLLPGIADEGWSRVDHFAFRPTSSRPPDQ
jgi:hypothetical protein